MTDLHRLTAIIESKDPLSIKEGDRSHYSDVAQVSDDRLAMYKNTNDRLGIDFAVERLEFAQTETLDPRLVRIAPLKKNEYHKHAHESLFVILSGQGRVLIDGREVEASKGDVVFVPRWVFHQTINTSSTQELVLLAITDFGLTSAVLGDYDKRTRLKSDGDDVQAYEQAPSSNK